MKYMLSAIGVTVLRDGALVGSLDKPQIRADTIVRHDGGREVSSFYKKSMTAGEVRAPRPRARRHHRWARVRVALDRACSEVVGLPALSDAGRTELAHLISGLRPDPGHVELEGRGVTIRTLARLSMRALPILPKTGRRSACFLDMSCLDNINLAMLGRARSRLHA